MSIAWCFFAVNLGLSAHYFNKKLYGWMTFCLVLSLGELVAIVKELQ